MIWDILYLVVAALSLVFFILFEVIKAISGAEKIKIPLVLPDHGLPIIVKVFNKISVKEFYSTLKREEHLAFFPSTPSSGGAIFPAEPPTGITLFKDVVGFGHYFPEKKKYNDLEFVAYENGCDGLFLAPKNENIVFALWFSKFENVRILAEFFKSKNVKVFGYGDEILASGITTSYGKKELLKEQKQM